MIPYDELCKQTIARIEAAFTATLLLGPGNPASERCWQDLSDEELEEAYSSYWHIGNEDLPFYLPALMRRALRQQDPEAGDFDVDSILDQLSYGPGFLHNGQSSIFTAAEEETIAVFLFIISRHGRDQDRETAEAALQIGWWKYLPELAFTD